MDRWIGGSVGDEYRPWQVFVTTAVCMYCSCVFVSFTGLCTFLLVARARREMGGSVGDGQALGRICDYRYVRVFFYGCVHLVHSWRSRQEKDGGIGG